MRSQDDMSGMFDTLTDLSPVQRTTIKERYRFMLREYRRRIVLYSFLFYVLRMTMTVGSLAVPALLSLKTTPDGAEALYWFTWGMSLAVTTANGLSTLFKVDKRFFMIRTVAEQLRTETWQFLALSGRYSGYYGGERPTHANQYVYYTTRLEKIRMRHIEEEYVRNAEMGDQKQNTPTQTQTQQTQPQTSQKATSQDIQQRPPRMASDQQNPLAVPTPAQLPPESESRLMRRDSNSTLGSDDTNSQKEATAVSMPGRDGEASVRGASGERDTILLETSELPTGPAVGGGATLQSAGLQLRSARSGVP
jgi:hypothetical protein